LRFGVGFLHEVFQSGMVSEDYDLGIDKVGSKLSKVNTTAKNSFSVVA